VQVTPEWWVATLVIIAALMTLDLVLGGRHPGVDIRRSVRWVGLYIGAALAFGVAVWVGFGATYGGQFIAGWLTEYSLSVDNLFVFLVLMTRFAVPASLQLRVLTYGIVIALVLRFVLIMVGAAALERYSWLFYIFAAFLIWTAVSLLRGGPHEPGAEDVAAGEEPRAARLIGRIVPSTPVWHGTKPFVRQGNRLVATPIVVTMLAIGVTDVLFALDSIPAIFGLTQEPFLVVSANAFALMGLRQLFFVVREVLDRLRHIDKGLSLVLAFIGVKLALEALHGNQLSFINGGEPVDVPEISTAVSLGVVVGVLGLTAVTSLIAARRDPRPAPPRDEQAERPAGMH
jgi:tellurite resistance protein TerC